MAQLTFSRILDRSKHALWRVPRILIAVITTITVIATIFAASGDTGTSCPRSDENATASVAIDPVVITKKLAHPYRKAVSGPKASRMYT